jgi:hypothetical protein
LKADKVYTLLMLSMWLFSLCCQCRLRRCSLWLSSLLLMASFQARAQVVADAQVAVLASAEKLSLSSHEFKRLTSDLGQAVAFRALSPATPLGLSGFELAVTSTAYRVASGPIWQRAIALSPSAEFASHYWVPGLRVGKGLPWDMDVGLSLNRLPGFGAQTAGLDWRWALHPGSILMPAIGLRLSASQSLNEQDLRIGSQMLELRGSKGFGPLSLTAAYSVLRSSLRLDGGLAAALFDNPSRHHSTQLEANPSFGLHLNLLVADMSLQWDRHRGGGFWSAALGYRF